MKNNYEILKKSKMEFSKKEIKKIDKYLEKSNFKTTCKILKEILQVASIRENKQKIKVKNGFIF